ncbi:MAG TPA: hypothetical protein VLF62_04300 [Candidatus Saccharimonadales bacterium]|nr:hypothetical protein [Candidatus Saccharimonadales bacterium]
MSSNRNPTRPEIITAGKLLEEPMPDPHWRWEAACADAPLIVLPQESEDQVERNMRTRSFIGNYCGSCTVQTECMRDSFDTYTEAGPTGIVLGGNTPGKANKIWNAANAIRRIGSVDGTIAHYEALAAKKPAESASVATEASALSAPPLPAAPPQAA